MGYEESLQSITLPAAADLSLYQYRFVKINSSGQAALCGDGEAPDGILQNKPSAAGQAATVGISGVSKLVLSGVIAAGTEVASDANGKGTTATTGDVIGGKNIEAAAADGDIVAFLFQPRNAYA